MPSVQLQECFMVSLLCAVAMETVCGMWFNTCARKCSPPIEEQPQNMKMSGGRNASAQLVYASCSLL